MRVIGFDPGTATTGYGVIEVQGSRLHPLEYGVITTTPESRFDVRLMRIHEEAKRLLDCFQPAVVAIEKLYFKQNITTGIAVAQARGVLALAVAQAGIPVREYSPTEVKLAITGYGKADKRQVQEMIKMLLNLDVLPKPDDAADALGLAICQIHVGAAHREC